MVKLRLMRMGAKANPHYRIVAVDSRKKRSSDYIESLGYYDPRKTTEEPVRINAERTQHWLSSGAQPTEPVLRLFEKHGIDVGAVKTKRLASYKARQQAAQAQ